MIVISKFVKGSLGVRIVYRDQSSSFQVETGRKDIKGRMHWGCMPQRMSLVEAKESFSKKVAKIMEYGS